MAIFKKSAVGQIVETALAARFGGFDIRVNAEVEKWEWEPAHADSFKKPTEEGKDFAGVVDVFMAH